MVRYRLASGSTSGGVFMNLSIRGVMDTPMAVNSTPSTPVMTRAVWTVSLTLSVCLAP